jgi:flavin reductase (DIM6/NTAB) family NADH-FMN oxidoreductase RutF
MTKKAWKPGTMLFPVPPVMVTCGTMEKPNVLTVAWTGIINSEPPMTYISVRPTRFSHKLIEQSGEFVINIANLPLAKACDFCGVRSGQSTDKFKEMNLDIEPCSKVAAPMLKDAPVSLECKVFEVKHFGTHDMFMAEIVNVNVDDKYVEKDGRLALEKAGLLAFAHGRYYTLGRDLGGFGFSVDKTKENKTKPRKSKFMEILKIEEQIKEGTLKIKEKKPSLQKALSQNKHFKPKDKQNPKAPNKNKHAARTGRSPFGTRGKTWFRKKAPKAAE